MIVDNKELIQINTSLIFFPDPSFALFKRIWGGGGRQEVPFQQTNMNYMIGIFSLAPAAQQSTKF